MGHQNSALIAIFKTSAFNDSHTKITTSTIFGERGTELARKSMIFLRSRKDGDEITSHVRFPIHVQTWIYSQT